MRLCMQDLKILQPEKTRKTCRRVYHGQHKKRGRKRGKKTTGGGSGAPFESVLERSLITSRANNDGGVGGVRTVQPRGVSSSGSPKKEGQRRRKEMKAPGLPNRLKLHRGPALDPLSGVSGEKEGRTKESDLRGVS